jgi:two-component system cell cycle sensor histidine kinase/response regulator CckA
MVTSKTVLVVEDDAALRLVVKKALEAYGYSVIPAEDSVIANAMARLRGGIVDILLADINLPGLTGGEYASFLKSINPNLKVLYMSGSMDDALVRQHLRNKTATFLQKPFTNQELVLAVKRALGEIPEDRI